MGAGHYPVARTTSYDQARAPPHSSGADQDIEQTTREQTDAMEHVTHGITLDGVARFVDIATDALSSAREEIDALNVYPVPDGDTGTNMFLTVSTARDALREAPPTIPTCPWVTAWPSSPGRRSWGHGATPG